MSATQLRVTGAGLFYLLIFLSGVRLTRMGKPYSGVILTAHKLISLAAALYLSIAVFQIGEVAGVGVTGWIAVAVTGVSYLATVVTGGLWSIDRPMPTALLTLHRITPFLTLLATALTTIFLLGTHW